jgi:hypothetical protein
MTVSARFLTNRRICRKVWDHDSEDRKKEAIAHIVEAAHYELSNEQPPKEFWS